MQPLMCAFRVCLCTHVGADGQGLFPTSEQLELFARIVERLVSSRSSGKSKKSKRRRRSTVPFSSLLELCVAC